MLTRFQKKYRSVQANASPGQSMIEYAGMIVLSTLMVGCMMSGTQQIMPVLFTALSHRNAAALSDTPPLPAADFPAPSTEPDSQPISPSGNATPEPEKSLQTIFPPVIKAQILPSIPMMDAQREQLSEPLPLPLNNSVKPTTGVVTSLTPHLASDPAIAPPPPLVIEPKGAQPPRMATDPKLALQPRLAPSPLPAPEPKVISASGQVH